MKKSTRLLSIVLAVLMVISMVPVAAYAETTMTADSLQAAINNGGEIALENDIQLTQGLTVPAGVTVTLDLNGKTITGTPAEAKAFAVITNLGNLTITDSVGGGAVVCDHKLTGSTAYAVNTIANSGTLTVKGGTVENKSTASNQIGYAIDNLSTSYDAVVVIEGGVVKASGSNYYDGIRLFCNNLTKENSVTVNGGTISSIWLQNPSDGSGTKDTKDVKGSVTINGGTVNALYLEPSTGFDAAITGGNIGNVSYFTTSEGRDLTGFITGGTFGTMVSEEFLAEDTKLVEKDGSFVVADSSVTVIGTKEELLAFAEKVNAGDTFAGKTVVLVADIDLSSVANWTSHW